MRPCQGQHGQQRGNILMNCVDSGGIYRSDHRDLTAAKFADPYADPGRLEHVLAHQLAFDHALDFLHGFARNLDRADGRQ